VGDIKEQYDDSLFGADKAGKVLSLMNAVPTCDKYVPLHVFGEACRQKQKYKIQSG
jgi:hypothetical protein